MPPEKKKKFFFEERKIFKWKYFDLKFVDEINKDLTLNSYFKSFYNFVYSLNHYVLFNSNGWYWVFRPGKKSTVFSRKEITTFLNTWLSEWNRNVNVQYKLLCESGIWPVCLSILYVVLTSVWTSYFCSPEVFSLWKTFTIVFLVRECCTLS